MDTDKGEVAHMDSKTIKLESLFSIELQLSFIIEVSY